MNLDNYPSSNTYNYPLIIECCKITPDLSKLESLASQITDWDKFIDSAYAHGIFPLVAKSLKSIPNIPQSAKLLLKTANIDIAQHNMRATSELIKVVKLLEENNIKAITFKGPALSQIAYGDVISRQYGDLDLLIDRGQILRAVKLLVEAGYVNVLPLKILGNETCLDIVKDFAIINEKNRVAFELHWKLFEKKYSDNMFNGENKYTQTVTLNGYELRTIEDEIFLVYLCLHGSKHMWERIEWICDIDRLIRNRSYDWEKIISFSLSLNQTDGIFLGFALTQHLFQTPLPKVLEQYTNKKRIESLIQEVIDVMHNGVFNGEDFKRNKTIFLFQSKLYNTSIMRMKFFLGVLFNTSAEDCQTFYVNDSFKFLYLFLRPYRLIRKVFLKVVSG